MEKLIETFNRNALEKFTRNPCVQQKHRDASLFPGGLADLRRSARLDNMDEVRGLLGVGADATATDAQDNTAEVIAHLKQHTEVADNIAWGHDELVRALTACLGRTPTRMEIYGATTLKKLGKFRHEVLAYVQERAAQLVGAARIGDAATVRVMLERGEIGVNVVNRTTGATVWSAAVVRGDFALCAYLKANGARMEGVYWVNGESRSLLVAAVLTGDVALVRWLVSEGAPVVDSADKGMAAKSALTEAVRTGSVAMMETLLDLGVRFESPRIGLDLPMPLSFLMLSITPSRPSDRRREPWLLLCAACWFQDRQVFRYLLEKYPVLQDLSQHPRNAAIVLFLAVYQENEPFVLELVRRGASVNGGLNLHAMDAAVLTNSTRMLELLLVLGGDVEALSNDYVRINCVFNSLLEVAVFSDARDCALLLLPLETRRKHREAALVLASMRGNVELVTLILEQLGDLSASTRERCLDVAACPVTLDVLLSRFYGDELSILTLNDVFVTACHRGKRAELLAVYVAHGIDITHNVGNSTSQTSTLVDGILREWSLSSPATLEFVLAHGVPSLTTNLKGKTPAQEISNQCGSVYRRNRLKQRTHEACRAILDADSSRRAPT